MSNLLGGARKELARLEGTFAFEQRHEALELLHLRGGGLGRVFVSHDYWKT